MLPVLIWGHSFRECDACPPLSPGSSKQATFRRVLLLLGHTFRQVRWALALLCRQNLTHARSSQVESVASASAKGRQIARAGKPEGGANSDEKAGSSSSVPPLSAQRMMSDLPAVRLPPRVDPPKKRKFCSFLCGAECWVSPDPLDPSRRSIRWGNDTQDI